jgi:hypothetical protein
MARTNLGARQFLDAEYAPRVGRPLIANSKNRRGATEAPAILGPAAHRWAPAGPVGL